MNHISVIFGRWNFRLVAVVMTLAQSHQKLASARR